MNCPQCSGSMSPKQTPKGQVFECNQDNGTCLNAKGYPNSVWPKRGATQNAPQSTPAFTQRTASGGGSDDRSNRIERQHSQHMAILTVGVLASNGMISTPEEMKAKLKELTDYYQRDVGRTATATTTTQPEADPASEEVF